MRTGTPMRVTTLLALAALMTLSGCASNPDTTSTPTKKASSKPSPGKFDTTWTKDMNDTDCGDWQSAMSEQQRFVGAADMLTAARGSKLAADSLIRQFSGGISVARGVTDVIRVTEVATALYITEESRFAS